MSLRHKLLLPLLLACLMALGHVGLVWSPHVLTKERQAYLEDVGRHLDTVVDGLVPLLLSRQLDLVQANLGELKQGNPDWRYLHLADDQGRQLYPPRLPGAEPTHVAGAQVQVLEKPIRFMERNLGTLTVHIDIGPRLAAIREQQRKLMLMFVTIIGLLAIVWLGTLEVRVVQPLRRLSTAADELARQHFDTPLPSGGGDEVGRLVGSFAQMRADIQRYHDELRRFKAIVDSSDDAIIGKSLNGNITSWNHGAELLFGYSAAEAVGQPMSLLMPPDRANEEQAILAGIARGDRFDHFETVRRHMSGRLIDISATISPVLDESGKVVGAAKIARDITERKRADAELERYRNHLEILVEERTAALTVAKELAEAANRAKSMFLANMSHELRTPMNAIMGLTDLATRRASDPKQQDQLTKVTQASRHLLSIIDDILDISRIQAERMTLEQRNFTLGPVMDNLAGLVSPSAAAKSLEFSVEVAPELTDLELRGDPARLGRILLNLASNAVKFTESGSIQVRVRLQEEQPTQIRVNFEVQDSGIGISAADRARLFTAFEQADGSMTRKYGGTGLGLAISKRLVEMMDGNIGVDSQPGSGSTFWFTARFTRVAGQRGMEPQPDPDATETRLRHECAGARILLVENEPINQVVSRSLLEDVGLKVDLAEDIDTALALARHDNYDLILLDIEMPGLDCGAIIRTLRNLPGYQQIPILAMTASAFDEDHQRCLEAGMDDHIDKPLDPDQLFATLLHWLAGPRH